MHAQTWASYSALYRFGRLRGYGSVTQEIYFRVPSKTTPTTILVAVIKAHRKTNLNAKTNPNPDLQKTCKKKLKEKRKKI